MTTYLYPCSNGIYTEISSLSTAWQKIADPENNPDDILTFISVGSNNIRQSVKLGIPMPVGGKIDSLTVLSRCYKSAIGLDGSIKNFIRINSTNYDGSTQTVPKDGTWNNYIETWNTNPATSLAWKFSDLDNIEAGILVISNGGSVFRITQLYISIVCTFVTFAINGGVAIPGVKANWQRVPKRTRSDGTVDYQPYAIHTWDISTMTVANYQTFEALRGKPLASLDTTDINNRNVPATYTDVEFKTITGSHTGNRMTGNRLEFLVKVV